MNLGYIRVSTKEQNIERQIATLKKYNIEDRFLFIDKVSGTIKAENRDNYEVMKRVARKGDVIYIHELDRLGRSKSDILKELQYYKQEGITLKILDIPTTLVELNTNNETSNLIFEMVNNILIEVLATLAEQEVTKLHQRQREGIEMAKKRGVRFGRPPVVLPDEFYPLYEKWKNKEIAAVDVYKSLNMPRSTFYKIIKNLKI